MNTSVLLCLLGILAFYQSYKQFQKNKYKFSIIYILLGGSLLRWTGVKDPYIHAWDERYHFLVAKNLLNNWLEPKLYPYPLLEYDYTHWGTNYIWLHKPPFALWTIAASFKLFGINELAGRVPSFCFSIACILLTYHIGLLLFKNQKLALLAAFFHAINGLVIEISVGRVTTDHIDTTFFFLLEFGIYLSLRFAAQKRFITFLLIGIVMGLAVLTKWYIGFFILPMFGLANLSKSSLGKVIVLSCVLALIAVPIFYSWQFYIHQSFPKEAAWESNYNFKHLFEAIEGHAHPWWYYLDKARICWNELIYVAFLTFLVRWWRQPMQFSYYFLGFWVIVPYTIFSYSATKMQGYVLWTAPAFFILLALFLVELPLFFSNHRYFKYISIVIILLSVRYSLERIKPFNDIDHLSNQKQKIRAYQTQLKPRIVLFNTTQAIEIMFYTDFLAYEKVPTFQEIQKVKQAGYSVGIIEGKSLSTDILKDTTILKVSSNEIMLK